MLAYMYKEGKKCYVVYGDEDSFSGPQEKIFTSENKADEFLREKKNEYCI